MRQIALLFLVLLTGCPWWSPTGDTSHACEIGKSGREVKCLKPGGHR